MFLVYLGFLFYVFLSNNIFWVVVIIKIIKFINFICYVLCILVLSYCFVYKIKKRLCVVVLFKCVIIWNELKY